MNLEIRLFLPFRLRILFFLLLIFDCFFLLKPASGFDVPEIDIQKFPVEIYGDYLEYKTKANQVVVKGKGFIAYKDMKISADTIQANTKSEDLFAQGDVDFWKGYDRTTGNFLVYNMKTGKGWMRDASIRRNRNFFKAKEVYVSPSYSIARDILQTTCDNEAHPHYRIKAKEIEVYPGHSTTMKDLYFRWRGTNLYHKAIDSSKFGKKEKFFSTKQGYSQIDGIYVKFGTNMIFKEGMVGVFNYDYFEKRGFGTGFSTSFANSTNGNGAISLYNLDETKRAHKNLQTNLTYNYRFKNGDSLATNFSYTGDKVANSAENQDLNTQVNLNTRLKFLSLNITTSKFFDIDGDKFEADNGYQILDRLPEINFTLPGFTLPVLPISSNLSGMYGRYEEGNLLEKKKTEKKDIRMSFNTPSIVVNRRFNLTPSYNLQKSWYSDGVERESGSTMVRASQKFSSVMNMEFNYNISTQKGKSPFKFDSITSTDVFSTRFHIAEHSWSFNPVNLNYNRVAGRLEQVYWDYSRRSNTNAYHNWEFFLRRDYIPDPIPLSKMDLTRLTPSNLNVRYRLASNLWSFDTSFTYPHEYRRITDSGINYSITIRPLWQISMNGHYNHLIKRFSPLNIALVRDLHCWEARAEYNHERKEIWMEFYLKEYPDSAGRFRYGADTNKLEAKFAAFDQMTQKYGMKR